MDIINGFSVIFGIVGVIVGIIFGMLTQIYNKNLAVKEFFVITDSPEFRESRARLYELLEGTEEIDIKNPDLRRYISYYDFCGIMIKKRFLPFWVFEGAAGKKLLHTMKKIEDKGILGRFKGDGNFEPKHYEYLFNKLKKFYRQKCHRF